MAKIISSKIKSDDIEMSYLQDTSALDTPSDSINIDSDVLIENIQRDLSDTSMTNMSMTDTSNENNDDKTDDSDSNKLTKDNNESIKEIDLNGILANIFANSYHTLLFNGYQVFNLLLSLMLLSLFVFVRRSMMLALFLMGLLGIQLPVAYHHVAKSGETRKIYDAYFIQTGVYYAFLSIYSVIVNAYYGDGYLELIRLFIYSNVPTMLSIGCFMLSSESNQYGKFREYEYSDPDNSLVSYDNSLVGYDNSIDVSDDSDSN